MPPCGTGAGGLEPKVNLLEKVGSVSEAEERYGVGHHPDVASAAVKVRFAPFAIFVGNAQDLVVVTFRVRRFVGRVRVISCNKDDTQTLYC